MSDLYPSRLERESIIDRVDPTVYSDVSVGEYSMDNISRSEYEDNGYIVFPNIFSEDEVTEMLNELKYMASNEDLIKNEEFRNNFV